MDVFAPASLSRAASNEHGASAPADGVHTVDALIEERAQKLMAKRWLWPIVKAVIYPAFGYRRAVAFADAIADMSAQECMAWASDFLDMSYDSDGVAQIPAEGPAVVVANHPGGIADGVAVWDAIKHRRPDACFFANRDALRVCAGLASIVIPVEWRAEERNREKTRETLRLAIEAFKAGRCVVVFPAGRMSEWSWRARALKERAAHRGFELNDQAAKYLLDRYHRQTGHLFDILDKLDKASLEQQRVITIPFLRSLDLE